MMSSGELEVEQASKRDAGEVHCLGKRLILLLLQTVYLTCDRRNDGRTEVEEATKLPTSRGPIRQTLALQ